LPTVRAEIELRQSQAALELLNSTAPYELGEGRKSPCLYAVYVRGEAYLRAKESEAASEFQILQRSVSPGPYSMQGDTAKARTAYKDFLPLWKNADSGIPVLKEAKGEYAKLQ
jgi:hypothetical protein